jgi:Xaa-Pro aminopeptidase
VAPPPLAVAGIAAGPAERRAALGRRLVESGAAALLVLHPPNIRYLTGFPGGGALVLTEDGATTLVTVPMNGLQAREVVDPAVEVALAERQPLETARERLCGRGPVAFEKERLTVAQLEAWEAAGGPDLTGIAGWVESLRAVKSEAEKRAIEAAGAVAVGAWEAVLPAIRPGVTEIELAARLEAELRARGAERFAFDTIVLFGPRAALPHGEPAPRPLASGEVVLFDFGAVVDGYVSDVSRTVACGPPDPRLADAYEVVRRAQRSAIDGLREGRTGREVDALGRGVIEEAGHGEAFVHSLGHGIGLEVHEGPRLWKGNDEPVPAGAVVTVEPGIYIAGLGGIRIEDDVAVSREGAHPLTGAAPDALVAL